MGAIAAAGKKIDFDKKTITDKKTGKVSTFKRTRRGIIIRPKNKPKPSSEVKVNQQILNKAKEETKKIQKSSKTPINSKKIQQEQLVKQIVLSPEFNKQFTQQQTITDEARLRPKDTPEGFKVNLELRGKEKVKRGVRGEILLSTPFGYQVRKSDGTFRSPTKTELQELQPKTSTTLNPFNFGTAFLGISKDISNLIESPSKRGETKKALIEVAKRPDKALTSILTSLVTNPAGFAGETYAGTKVLQAGKVSVVKGNELINKGFKGLQSTQKKRLNTINDNINKIRDKTTQTRQDKSILESLKQEKKILEADLNDISKAIGLTKKPPKSESGIKKQNNDLRKVSRNIKNRKKQRVKLKPETQARKLGELFKQETKLPTVKVILDTSKPRLERLLLEARKVSGDAFSKLKKKIEKTTGLKVVQRTVKGKVVFKLLEPKKPRPIKKSDKAIRITIESKGRTPKTQRKEILLPASQVKKFKVEKQKLKAAVKEVESQIDVNKPINIDLVVNKAVPKRKKKGIRDPELAKRLNTLFSDKKARATLIPKFRTVFKKRNKNYGVKIKELRSQFKNLNVRTNTIFSEFKKAKRVSTKKRLKDQLDNLNKQRTKLKKDINKQLSILRKDIKLATRLQKVLGIAAAVKTLKSFPSILDNINKNITKINNRIDNIKPIDDGSPTRPPQKPKTSGRGTPKPVTRPRPKARPKPVPKPIPKPELDFDSKLPRGTRLKFDAFYRAKGRLKKLELGLPLNKALRRISNLVDNTTARSMQLKIIGTTKAKDITKPKQLKKFRPKKSKNKKVLTLVEKSKNAIDSRGEKKGLSLSKFLAKRKKKPSRAKKRA